MEKYQKDSKIHINNLYTNEGIAELTIDAIQLSNVTSNNIVSIQTASSDIEHPPLVNVIFDTGYTKVSKSYRIDPFVLPPFENEKYKLFGNLLYYLEIEWDELYKLIGEKIKFNTKNFTIINNKNKSSNYNYLIDCNKSNLYHEKIDSLFIDLIYNQAHNLKLKYATVEEINVIKNYVKITFKLPYEEIFIQKLPLNKNVDFSYEKIFDTDVIGPKQDKSYTFWKFCEDTLGYIPNQEDYSKIINEQVDVVYTVSGWKIKQSMKNINY